MLLAASSSYSLLNIFWTTFIFFLWVPCIWILIMVFIDIFRSHDLSGWAKALWFLFVLFIPLIGVLVHLNTTPLATPRTRRTRTPPTLSGPSIVRLVVGAATLRCSRKP